MNNETVNIMEAGLSYLVEKLGVLDAERFIVEIKRDRFDYTKWQRDLFNDMSLEELTEMAVEYEKEHPHEGVGKRI